MLSSSRVIIKVEYYRQSKNLIYGPIVSTVNHNLAKLQRQSIWGAITVRTRIRCSLESQSVPPRSDDARFRPKFTRRLAAAINVFVGKLTDEN